MLAQHLKFLRCASRPGFVCKRTRPQRAGKVMVWEEARALVQQISLLKEEDEASRTTSRGLRGGCRGGGKDE